MSLDNITPYNDLYSEAKDIQSFAEITAGDNPQEIAERITDCGVYIARTGKMLADAKEYYGGLKKASKSSLFPKTKK